MGERPLKEEFSGLFFMVTDKKAIIADTFDFEWSMWNPRFRRNVFDWEIDELFRFLSLLENHKPDRSQRDNWI